MGRKGHSEEQIVRILRTAESGDPLVEVCRKHGVSQQSLYLWRKKYDGLGRSELRELRQLRCHRFGSQKLTLLLSPTTSICGLTLLYRSFEDCRALKATYGGEIPRQL